MTEIPRYLSDDEATVVQAALEPFKQTTFTFRGRGSFAQFAKLPAKIRFAINYNLTEHGNILDDVVIYAEPQPMRDSHYYAIGIMSNKKLMAFEPLLNPPTPHIIDLAKESTGPWTFWGEIQDLGVKGVAAILICYLISILGYFRDNSPWWAFVFLGMAILCTVWSFVVDPLMDYRQSARVTKALLALEELKTAPQDTQSPESIIRARGGHFGPGKVDGEPKPA